MLAEYRENTQDGVGVGILGLMRMSLPSPRPEAAREGTGSTTWRERLCGENCQTGAVTFPLNTNQI